jgi:hypothetical protein
MTPGINLWRVVTMLAGVAIAVELVGYALTNDTHTRHIIDGVFLVLGGIAIVPGLVYLSRRFRPRRSDPEANRAFVANILLPAFAALATAMAWAIWVDAHHGNPVFAALFVFFAYQAVLSFRRNRQSRQHR